MTRQRLFGLWLATILFSLVVPAQGQQSTKIPKVGILQSAPAEASRDNLQAFQAGLWELGYEEGKNIVLLYRHANGEVRQLPALASDLVKVPVDAMVVAGTQSTLAAREATSTIPIIVGAAGDLVRTGLIKSLARPGGNVTGSTVISPDIGGKRVALLTEVVPKALRIGVLLYSSSGTDRDEAKQIEAAAQSRNIKIQMIEVRDPKDFQKAEDAVKAESAKALILLQSSFTTSHRKQLAEIGTRNRIPTMCESARWAEAGCALSYGPDLPHQYRRAAVYLDKILKGAKPSDLPVEQPSKFEFIVNMKTTNQIGLSLSQSVLYRATRVIR